MTEFGFEICKDNTLELTNSNQSIALFVLQREPSLYRCIQCGSCTATCSAGAFTRFEFRKLHHLMRLGQTESLAEAVKKCMLCGKCQMVCPRGVNTRNVMRQIRIALSK